MRYATRYKHIPSKVIINYLISETRFHFLNYIDEIRNSFNYSQFTNMIKNRVIKLIKMFKS